MAVDAARPRDASPPIGPCGWQLDGQWLGEFTVRDDVAYLRGMHGETRLWSWFSATGLAHTFEYTPPEALQGWVLTRQRDGASEAVFIDRETGQSRILVRDPASIWSNFYYVYWVTEDGRLMIVDTAGDGTVHTLTSIADGEEFAQQALGMSDSIGDFDQFWFKLRGPNGDRIIRFADGRATRFETGTQVELRAPHWLTAAPAESVLTTVTGDTTRSYARDPVVGPVAALWFPHADVVLFAVADGRRESDSREDRARPFGLVLVDGAGAETFLPDVRGAYPAGELFLRMTTEAIEFTDPATAEVVLRVPGGDLLLQQISPIADTPLWVSLSDGQGVRIVRIDGLDAQVVLTVAGQTQRLFISPDGGHALISQREEDRPYRWRVFDLATGAERGASFFTGMDHAVRPVWISPSELLVSDADGTSVMNLGGAQQRCAAPAKTVGCLRWDGDRCDTLSVVHGTEDEWTTARYRIARP